jgi:hypothetical protein
MRKLIAPLFASLFFAACGNNNPQPALTGTPPFDAKAAAYIHKQGTTLIQGEAFLIGDSGKPLYAAGELIRLVPATAYARARFKILYRSKTFIPAGQIPKVSPDPEYSKYTRTTVANGRGKFLFDNVAAGDYFVTAQKIIQPPGSFIPRGGAMYAQVRINGSERYPVKTVITGR